MDRKLRETTYVRVEIMNSKRQVKRKPGHVQQIPFAVWRKLNVMLNLSIPDHVCSRYEKLPRQFPVAVRKDFLFLTCSPHFQ